MNWWQSLLLGGAAGLIVMPIFVWIARLYKNTKERIKIKRMIKNNEFLIPIDERDYNVKMWEDKFSPDKEYLNKLNDKIFIKAE